MAVNNLFFLTGKTILITGASSGIGRQTAMVCANLGAKCVITGRNEDRLNETLSSLAGNGHISIVADISPQEGIELLAQGVPELDGLVNNAGIAINKPIAFYKQEDLNNVFQTNTFAPMMLVKALVKKKKMARGCSIVFTSSVASFHSDLSNGIYGASKAALTAYMHYVARELAPKGIRANAVHPGMIETKLIHGGAISEDDLQKDMQKYPLGRYGKPEEVAYSIAFLLSDASSWTTGTSLIVDGGLSLL